MKSKYILAFFLLVVFVLVSVQAYADDPHEKSVMAPSKASIITPISLVNTDGQGLDFGSVIIGSTTSVVEVSATETVVPNVISGNASVMTGVPQTAAKFLVSGELEKLYLITLPASMTIQFGTEQLTIDHFSCSNGADGYIGTDDVFYVGGQLTVPASAVPGFYQGTFNVTVAYN